MMIRRFFAILLALPLAAAMAFSAEAQSNSSPYFRPSTLPPVMANDNDAVPPSRDPQLGPPPRGVYQDRTDTLPPPGFAPPYGHQFNSATPAEPPAAGDVVVRPPGAVGNAPQAAPQPQAPAGAALQPQAPAGTAALPPEDQPETGQPKELPANLKRQLVDYATKEPAGTIVVDTANTYLYLVLGGGKAIRYGVRVGRDGFTWTGTERISRMKEWPDWFPPSEMIERQPYLPRMMAGGAGNPLGARAMYLGHTLYRIHGTNQPSTIGHYVSSGCVGMLNEDVEDLYDRVQVGTRVVVLQGKPPETVANSGAPAPATPANLAPTNTAVSNAPLPPAR
jgi:lipoprotein-anchoring transpeptidase ErfK/SrfK